ncbi:RNA polymerase II-associated protein [Auriculariales sp. MPI-PUGE-AT-0066]|nr:RNA polymerase II-associated protein [Auriculariales sp. MPI-PUGE-AT-0066]
MAAVTDALLALRDAIKHKATIELLNSDGAPTTTYGQVAKISIPVDGGDALVVAKTEASRYRGNQGALQLGAVYAAYLFRNAGAAEYMRSTRELGYASTAAVPVGDRKALADWLEGRLAQHVRIERTEAETGTPPGSPKQQAKTSAGSQPLAGAPTSTPAKRKYEPDKADVEAVKRIRQNEVELRDRTTVLRGSKVNNFSSVRNLVSDRLKRLREAKANASSSASTSAPKADPKLANKKRTNYPIIIISSSPTSLITMSNVKKFLEEASFVSPDVARADAANSGKPEDVIAIYRKRTHIAAGGKEVETRLKYFVVDSVEALAKFGNGDPWDRVVCVMTTGQAWQFRPYKWSEPLQLFHNVKGIYVSWANDPPNPKIKDWNVAEVKIDQYRRHVDKSTVAAFWKTIDTWMAANKPGLQS